MPGPAAIAAGPGSSSQNVRAFIHSVNPVRKFLLALSRVARMERAHEYLASLPVQSEQIQDTMVMSLWHFLPHFKVTKKRQRQIGDGVAEDANVCTGRHSSSSLFRL